MGQGRRLLFVAGSGEIRYLHISVPSMAILPQRALVQAASVYNLTSAPDARLVLFVQDPSEVHAAQGKLVNER